MPEGNIAPEKFARNGAEEVLYRNEMRNTKQDPDRLPRWRRKTSAACSSLPPVTLSDDGSEPDLSENFEPEEVLEAAEDVSLSQMLQLPPVALKPLPPPSPVGGSPFKGVLGFLHKDPFELEAKREAALRRDVKQMLRQVYRRSVEATGSYFRAEDPPWPPKEKKLDHPGIKKVSPLGRWVFSLPKPAAVPKKAKALLPADPVNLARQATVQTMRAFGRSGQGGPYTLRQVYEEVEADVHHRPPADVRASTGRLGPELLGPGTTRMRRKLPFAHPQMLMDSNRSKSAGSLPRGPFVPDLWT